MAKSKTGLYIGLAVAAGAAYLLLTKKSPATVAPGTTPLQGSTTPAGSAASSSPLSLVPSLLQLGQTLFGSGSSAPSLPYAPVNLAPTGGTSPVSPAAGLSFIDPTSAPSLDITAPSIDTSTVSTDPSADLSNIFL